MEQRFNEDYLNSLIDKAHSAFDNIDAEEYLNEVRGREENVGTLE